VPVAGPLSSRAELSASGRSQLRQAARGSAAQSGLESAVDVRSERVSFLYDPQAHLKAKAKLDIGCGDPFIKLRENQPNLAHEKARARSLLKKTAGITLQALPGYSQHKQELEAALQHVAATSALTSG